MDRVGLVSSIARALIFEEKGKWRSLQNVVAITGRWGSGKSSLLNFVSKHLEALPGVLVIRFEPWLISSEVDIIDAFLREIARKLGADKLDKAKAVADEIDTYRSAIAGVADYAFPGAGLVTRFLPKLRKPTIESRRKKLSEALEKFDGAIVVVIDELDRVEKSDVREVAKFINSVAAIPSMSFLIGYDYPRLSGLLSSDEDPQSGEEYLKKIVQLDIPLRGMFDYEMERELGEGIGLARYAILREDEGRWASALSACSPLLENPRDIKRVCLAYHLLADAVADEINPIDTFCYAVISASSQSVLSALHDRIDHVVIDPARSDMDFIAEIMAERDGERGVMEKLALDADKYRNYKGILEFLLPRENRRDEVESFGRALERKNLLTLIFLGNPPFRLSRAKMSDLWAQPSVEAFDHLQSINMLAEFFAQIPKLFDGFASDNDEAAFAAFFEWVELQPVENWTEVRRYSHGFQEMLISEHQKGGARAARVDAILSFVEQRGEFLLEPSLVRHHMFAYGLVGEARSRDYDTIYSREHVAAQLPKSLARYSSAVLDGRWAVDFRDADPFYALVQADEWKAEHRGNLELALEDPDKLSRFAALFAPPGYSFGTGTMELLVSEEKLTALLGASYEDDRYLGRCRERMLKLIAGDRWA